jgi:hypothetical protein
MSLRSLYAALALALLLAVTSFADSISDRDLQLALVGSWVTPPDSGPEVMFPSRQVFNGDGTTQVFIYTTAECRVPAALIEGRWWIKNKVLSTEVTGTTDPRLIPIGEVQRVLIVAVEQDKVVFNADDQLHVREKSDKCFPPGAHRT